MVSQHKPQHLNYVILKENGVFYLFERLGKDVPFEAYNKNMALKVAGSLEDIFGVDFSQNSQTDFSENSEIDLPENFGNSNSDFSQKFGIKMPQNFEIEHIPYEVVFNE